MAGKDDGWNMLGVGEWFGRFQVRLSFFCGHVRRLISESFSQPVELQSSQ